MIVEDLMTRSAASVRPDQTLRIAAQIMWDRDCGALPVVDNDSGKAIGMITGRDICMATWSRAQAPNAIFVAEAMSPDLIDCGPEDTITDRDLAMRVLADAQDAAAVRVEEVMSPHPIS